MTLLSSFFSGLFLTAISALIGRFVELFSKTKPSISHSKSTLIGHERDCKGGLCY